MAWYTHVRRQFVGERFPLTLYEGLVDTLHLAISERIKRFTEFCEKLAQSSERYRQQMGDSASSRLILQKDELVNNRDQAGNLIRRCLEKSTVIVTRHFQSIIQ
jgi:hypothetical protein